MHKTHTHTKLKLKLKKKNAQKMHLFDLLKEKVSMVSLRMQLIWKIKSNQAGRGHLSANRAAFACLENGLQNYICCYLYVYICA
jgi:hypothetical protein